MQRSILNALLILPSMLAGSRAVLASGQAVGNGGDAIVCPVERAAWNGRRAVLLDYEENRQDANLTIDLGPATLDVMGRVNYALDRLQRLDGLRAERYRAKASRFFAETRFLSGVDLTDVPDSEHIAIPSGCVLKQLAIQATPQPPRTFRYTISTDLWDLLDDENKAGLILHEIIFAEAVEQGQTDSRRARIFNAYVSSSFADIQSRDYYLENALRPFLNLDLGVIGSWTSNCARTFMDEYAQKTIDVLNGTFAITTWSFGDTPGMCTTPLSKWEFVANYELLGPTVDDPTLQKIDLYTPRVYLTFLTDEGAARENEWGVCGTDWVAGVRRQVTSDLCQDSTYLDAPTLYGVYRIEDGVLQVSGDHRYEQTPEDRPVSVDYYFQLMRR